MSINRLLGEGVSMVPLNQSNKTLLDKLKRTLHKHNLVPDNKVIVGLSGGADSVALLHIMKVELAYEVVAVHVNHMLRGSDSDQDEAFVSQLCAKLNVPLYTFKEDVSNYAQVNKLSTEQAGREIRKKCFESVLKDHPNAVIATGHHRNDMVETFFMNLFRGSGINGLSSMAYKQGVYIKPLLDIPREWIEIYLDRIQCTYCTDHTNFENIYTRNKVRNVLLPLIKSEFNPSIEATIAQTAQMMGLEKEYWESKVQLLFLNYCHIDDKQKYVMIDREAMENLVLLERYYLWRYSLFRLLGDLKDIQLAHIEALAHLNQTGASYNVGRGISAFVTADAFYLGQSEDAIFQMPNQYKVRTMMAKEKSEALEIQKCLNTHSVLVDQNQIRGELNLRYRVDGDRFVPFGMEHSKKLKDFFIDQKVPRFIRDKIPIICDGEKIVWVYGYRQDDRTKVTKNTENILIISLERVV